MSRLSKKRVSLKLRYLNLSMEHLDITFLLKDKKKDVEMDIRLSILEFKYEAILYSRELQSLELFKK